MRLIGSLALSTILMTANGISATAAADATGIWRMENGKVTVRIVQCGEKLCGDILALAKPLDKKGRPKRDKENPSVALRNRPIIGLRILHGMEERGDDTWEGSIYNADDGNTYSSVMKLRGNEMRVKGCVAFICKSMEFHRVD